MKLWTAKVEWRDIVAFNNASRYSHEKGSPNNITFGILFKEFTLGGIKYMRILRNVVQSDDIEDFNTDDIIDIPKGCVSKIKKYEKIEVGKKYKVIMKK